MVKYFEMLPFSQLSSAFVHCFTHHLKRLRGSVLWYHATCFPAPFAKGPLEEALQAIEQEIMIMRSLSAGGIAWPICLG